MKFNEQPCIILAFFFGVITMFLAFLYILNYVNGETMAIFAGFTQLFLGINQINMAQNMDSKGIKNGNKTVGIYSLIASIFIFTNLTIKMIL